MRDRDDDKVLPPRTDGLGHAIQSHNLKLTEELVALNFRSVANMTRVLRLVLSFITIATTFSSCGSCPAATLFGSSSNSIGSHSLVPDIELTRKPIQGRSRRCNPSSVQQQRDPPISTNPPHVRVPTSGPSLAWRKSQGIASPPLPAFCLINIAFGPKIAPLGSASASTRQSPSPRYRLPSCNARRLAPPSCPSAQRSTD